MLEEAAFAPSDEMQDVLDVARDLIYNGEWNEYEFGGMGVPMEPAQWCVLAGLPGDMWKKWVSLYGEAFEAWFARGLQPTRIERAFQDALGWRALTRVLKQANPNASHIKLAMEIGGHLKEKPEPPPIPYLTEEEAKAALREIGVGPLRAALEEAEDLEAKRCSDSASEDE